MASKTGKFNVCGNVHGNFQSTWIIESFSSLNWQVGKYYYSEPFQLEKEGTRWCLTLFPGGDDEDSKGHVSCFLCKSNTKNEIVMKYYISFLNTEGEVLYETKYCEWITFTSEQGYSRAIERNTLMTMLIDDTLIVSAVVTHCVTSAKHDVGIDHWAEISPIKNLTEDFLNLWINKENTDFVINVEGNDIPVHSPVIGARSKVFAAMFKHDTLEKRARRVNITDLDKRTIDVLMEFIYSGSVRRLDFDLALELLRASDKYEVSGLKLYCSNYLISSLNDKNVCQILMSADVYNAEKLRGWAMKYLCNNLSKDDFEAQRSFLKTRPELVCDIVKELIEHKKNEPSSN